MTRWAKLGLTLLLVATSVSPLPAQEDSTQQREERFHANIGERLLESKRAERTDYIPVKRGRITTYQKAISAEERARRDALPWYARLWESIVGFAASIGYTALITIPLILLIGLGTWAYTRFFGTAGGDAEK